MIKKAVIPSAGLGTRLLSATKEQPKEMLPVFCRNTNGDLSVKPLVQLVFEQLFDAGIREYCFIVGRGKRAIEDHFTPDFEYVDRLNNIGKKAKHQTSNPSTGSSWTPPSSGSTSPSPRASATPSSSPDPSYEPTNS